MRIAVGNDHGGLPLRETVLSSIEQSGNELLDFGTNSPESVDYPDFAEKVSRAILSGNADRGIIICGSGVGACIAANKFKGIYAAVCHDTYTAHQGVEHDNMNVLCLGGRVIGSEIAREIVRAFLSAAFINSGNYLRRVNKVRNIENQNG